MAGNREIAPSKEIINAKYDACIDLTMKSVAYSSLAGAFGGLLFFRRSPVTRWASVAFGAGVGIGSAYQKCYRLFQESPTKLAPSKIVDSPAPQVEPPTIVDSPAPQVEPPTIVDSPAPQVEPPTIVATPQLESPVDSPASQDSKQD